MSSGQTFDKKMKRFIPLILTVSAVFIPMMFTHSCANTTEAPTGGAKDTIPPYIIDIRPLPGAVGVPVQGAKFVFCFNEFVTIKQATNIFLSPPQQKPPKARLRGKNLIVSFEDPLLENTTYTINFTDAIADANEGNMFAGYTYVFSTGERIDSMMITGTVQDCNTLYPVKGATVLLHTDLSDSAVYKTRPYAAVKTDDWGFFALPFIKDTLYRLYAIKDSDNDNMFNPETETVAFVDSVIRPVLTASDTVREILRYDMKDTVACLARRSEYELNLFREKPSKQYIVNKERTAERAAYITFMAPDAVIDSITIGDYKQSQIVSQFNLTRDSLELWINSRRAAPDTMKIAVTYLKTDSLGVLVPATEQIKLAMRNDRRTYSKRPRKNLKQEDTTCVLNLTADSKTVEQKGFEMLFRYPIIRESFDSIRFTAITPRQTEQKMNFSVERDSLNLRRYILTPKEKLQRGYEYILKVPHRAFRDINGFWSDSLEVKCRLPDDDKLSTLETVMSGVDRKYIVDLLSEKRDKVLRSYIIDSDATLMFPYLSEGSYCIRITEDRNRNSIVDSGSILEHRQPEKVKFYEVDGGKFIRIPAGAEVSQKINLSEIFK